MNSMEVVQEQHSQKLQEFETRLAAMETKYTVELNALKANCRAEVSSLRSLPLVFTAEHGTSRDYRGGDIIHFTHVIINIGNMYDDVTGVVSVPQHGVYSIYVRTDPPYGLNVYDDLELKVNGGHIINAIAEQGTLGSVFVSFSWKHTTRQILAPSIKKGCNRYV
nr:hypothetical protein BaRGS_011521 [Batillaria attramentaria]